MSKEMKISPEICPYPDLLCNECPVAGECVPVMCGPKKEMIKKVYKTTKLPDDMTKAVARSLGLV